MGYLKKMGPRWDDAIIQPVVQTVERVVEDPKLLAMVAISVFAPGVGTAIGSALGLGSGAVATVVGNTIVNTALNGGDVEKALVSAVIPVAGAEVASIATTAFTDLGMSTALADAAGKATAKAVVAEVTGKDAGDAFLGSIVSSGVNAVTEEIDAFKELPKPIQQAAKAGITSELTGGDGAKAATNALVSSGISSLRTALKDDTPSSSKETSADAGIPQQLVSATGDEEELDVPIEEPIEEPVEELVEEPTPVEEPVELSIEDEIAQSEGWPSAQVKNAYEGSLEQYTGQRDYITAIQAGFPDYDTMQQYGGDVEAYKRDQAALAEQWGAAEALAISEGWPSLQAKNAYEGDLARYRVLNGDQIEPPVEEPVVEEPVVEEPVVEEPPVEEPVVEEPPVEAPVEEPVEGPLVDDFPVEEPDVIGSDVGPLPDELSEEMPVEEPGLIPVVGPPVEMPIAPPAGPSAGPSVSPTVKPPVKPPAAPPVKPSVASSATPSNANDLGLFLRLLEQAGGANRNQSDAKAPDLAKIGYIYDWNSIFGSPEQEKRYGSPYGAYANGGEVRGDMYDINEQLLKILRG